MGDADTTSTTDGSFDFHVSEGTFERVIPRWPKSIVVVGPQGSGKSTLSRRVSHRPVLLKSPPTYGSERPASDKGRSYKWIDVGGEKSEWWKDAIRKHRPHGIVFVADCHSAESRQVLTAAALEHLSDILNRRESKPLRKRSLRRLEVVTFAFNIGDPLEQVQPFDMAGWLARLDDERRGRKWKNLDSVVSQRLGFSKWRIVVRRRRVKFLSVELNALRGHGVQDAMSQVLGLLLARGAGVVFALRVLAVLTLLLSIAGAAHSLWRGFL